MFGFALEATESPVPAARKLNVEDVMPLMVVAETLEQVVVETVPDAFTVRQLFPAVPSALKTTELAKVDVLLKFVAALKVCVAIQVTLDAAVTKPGFTKFIVTAPVAFDAEMFVPDAIDVTPTLLNTFPFSNNPVEIEVVPSEPEAFRNASVLVAKEKMVEELKVAVELNVAPLLKVCNAVHVTELAAVTNPGFRKE